VTGRRDPFDRCSTSLNSVSLEKSAPSPIAGVINEPASGVIVAAGHNSATNTQLFYAATPVQMRSAPTVTTSVGTFKVNSSTGGVVAPTGLAGNATHTPNAIGLTV
jgi:hypothetical protein